MNPLDISQMMGLMYPNGQPAGAPQMPMLPKAEAQERLQSVEKAEPADLSAPIPFYPSRKSLTQDPEMSLTGADVSSIAAAQKRAVERGVLSPKLAEYMLAIAMTEGHSARMGVISGNPTNIDPDAGFYASQRFKHSLSEMGLEEGKDYFTYRAKDRSNKMQNYIQPLQGSPAMAAAILGEKAKLQIAGGTDEGAIKAYNGKGKATEYIYGKEIPADTKRYLAKVLEARELYSHPSNASIVGYHKREREK